MPVLPSQSILAIASTLFDMTSPGQYPTHQDQHDQLASRDYEDSSTALIIGLPIAMAVLGLILMATLIYFLYRYLRRDSAGSSAGMLAPEMQQNAIQDSYPTTSAPASTPQGIS